MSFKSLIWNIVVDAEIDHPDPPLMKNLLLQLLKC